MVVASAENHLTCIPCFNFSNIQVFKIITKYLIILINYISLVVTEKDGGGYVFANFKFHLNLKLYFYDKTRIHFVKMT